MYIYDLYDKFLATKPSDNDVVKWRPNLIPGFLKEEMTKFVLHGMNNLKTDDMKTTIQNAFARYAL